jgi:hypothetical protein
MRLDFICYRGGACYNNHTFYFIYTRERKMEKIDLIHMMYQTYFLNQYSLYLAINLFRLLWILLISFIPFSASATSMNFLWYFHRAKLGPHRAKWATFCSLAGSVSSWNSLAVSGSNDRLNSFQRNRNALLNALSRYWTRRLWLNRSVCRNFIGYHTVFTSFIVGQVFWGDIAQHCASVPSNHWSDSWGNVVVTRSDICS